eukprot:4127859-Amphidinium_carterae.1
MQSSMQLEACTKKLQRNAGKHNSQQLLHVVHASHRGQTLPRLIGQDRTAGRVACAHVVHSVHEGLPLRKTNWTYYRVGSGAGSV